MPMKIRMTEKGSAERMVRDCRPDSASSPPVRSMTTAMPIMHAPQNNTMSFFGAGSPLEDMVPMTTEAESAEVMKKIERMTIRSTEVMLYSGSCSNMA